jgi:hypothetical protein
VLELDLSLEDIGHLLALDMGQHTTMILPSRADGKTHNHRNTSLSLRRLVSSKNGFIIPSYCKRHSGFIVPEPE